MLHRPAMSLIEVLVALFVMSVGLLALLALFPIGALEMHQAIKDSRCALAAANAASVAEAMQLRDDPLVFAALNANPPTLPAGVNPLPTLPAGYTQPGYPVYVDPFAVSHSAFIAHTTLPAGSPGIPRVGVSFVSCPAQFYRWGAVLDDVSFASADNQPAPPAPQFPYGTPVLAGTVVERDDRYTWAYMLRRPNFSVPSVVDCAIIVYSGRSPSVLGETAFTGVSLTQGSNTLSLLYDGARPDIRAGSWILDATVSNGTVPDPHGSFYRVVSVTDGAALNTLALELQTNLKQGSTTGVIVIIDNVVEVFEKGSGWQP